MSEPRKMITGQCHKYSEYDRLPTVTLQMLVIGHRFRTGPPVPATSTSPEPTTGTIAHGPGNPTSSVIQIAPNVMSASPTQASAGRIVSGTLDMLTANL